MSVNKRELALELKHVTKEYPGTLALKGIDLQVKSGTIHGFLGPNGAGKSTAMNIISGLIPPSEGEVFVLGHDVIQEPERAKMAIGLLPEHPPLYLNMRVEDYLKFSQDIHGGRDQRQLDHVLEGLGLTAMRRRLIGNLSKGYRQRVAMAQALVYQAPIIILDEPMVGLDPNAIAHMRELIKELKQDHTILLSTHQLYEAAKVCDEVTIIHQGLIKQTGPLADLEHHLRGMTSFVATVVSSDDTVIEQLKKLEGVRAVELQAIKEQERSLIIQVAHHQDLRAQLTKILVQHGDLLEFKEMHLELEDIFKQVVSRD